MAVVEDITEDVLLGFGLGRANLISLEPESTSKCVKLTRAQANAEITQERKDKLGFEASGASTHLISVSQKNFLVKIQLILLHLYMPQKV